MSTCPGIRSDKCLREHFEYRLRSAWQNIGGWQELHDNATREYRDALSHLSVAVQILDHCNDDGLLSEIGQKQLASMQQFIDQAESREPSTANLARKP